MIFVDEARIFVKAGGGGKGCESFYSDKYARYAKPDGGDGGRGGDVIFAASRNIQTLLDYRFKQHYQAANGGHGGSKNKTGKEGKDCLLKVPIGTLLWDHDNNLLIKDLVGDGQSVTVVHGGQGGRGNAHRRTPAPPKAGEQRTVRLELKVIADVGLIGFPNAGKSTIVSSISKVRSKIANYPFTTKQPILGIVPGDDFDFVVADLPGLIEGAHLGRGLGDRFLRHAERTKILVHVVDMSGSEGRDPLDDYEKINHELQEYSGNLFSKNRIVVANKMDLPEAHGHLARFMTKYEEKILTVSALEKKGLDQLVTLIRRHICHENSRAQSGV